MGERATHGGAAHSRAVLKAAACLTERRDRGSFHRRTWTLGLVREHEHERERGGAAELFAWLRCVTERDHPPRSDQEIAAARADAAAARRDAELARQLATANADTVRVLTQLLAEQRDGEQRAADTLRAHLEAIVGPLGEEEPSTADAPVPDSVLALLFRDDDE